MKHQPQATWPTWTAWPQSPAWPGAVAVAAAWTPAQLGADLLALWSHDHAYQERSSPATVTGVGDLAGTVTDLSSGGTHPAVATADAARATRAADGLTFGTVGAYVTGLSLTRPYTVVVVERSTGAGAQRTAGSSTANTIVSTGRSDGFACFLGGGVVSAAYRTDDVPHCAILTVTSGGCHYYIDGVDATGNGALTEDWPNFVVGKANGFAEAAGSTVRHCLCVGRAISAAEIAQLTSWAVGAVKVCVLDGNSFLTGYGLASPSTEGVQPQLLALLGGSASGWYVPNFAVVGQTTAQMTADAVAQVDPSYAAAHARSALVAVEATNSIFFGRTDAQALADYQAYGAARKAAGFRPVLFTDVVPRSEFDATKESYRVALNASLASAFNVPTSSPYVWLAAGSTTWGDGLLRLSLMPGFATTASEWMQADGVHENAAGAAGIAALARDGLALFA